MSVTTLAGGRKATFLFLLLAASALLLLGTDAFAQFGVPRPQAPPPPAPDGIAGWLIAKQAEFYRMLSGTIRAAKTDGSAVWLLMGISFAYGVFHAAGPGHGKAVISSGCDAFADVGHRRTGRRREADLRDRPQRHRLENDLQL